MSVGTSPRTKAAPAARPVKKSSAKPAAVAAPPRALQAPTAPRVSEAVGAMQEILRRRLHHAVADLVEQLSEFGLRNALEQSTGVESLEAVIGEVTLQAAAESTQDRVERLHDLYRAKSALLVRAGGTLSAAQVGELLGQVSRQAVEKRRERGTLLAVQLRGEYHYPLCQFEGAEVIEGLPRVLKAFTVQNGWTQLSVLLSEQDALDGRTVLQALRAGEVAAAVDVAASFGNTGS